MTETTTTTTGFFLDTLEARVGAAHNIINGAMSELRGKPQLTERTLAETYGLVDAFLTLLALEYQVVTPPPLRSTLMGIALICAQMGRDETTPTEGEK